ncbi:MAG: flagellar biosynthetic protein FliR, partial [Thermodesulfobacteriota bacterium]
MLTPILNNFETFFFVFIRVMAIFVMIPFIGSRTVPMQVKLGLGVVMALLITPTITETVHMPATVLGVSFLVFKELLIGFVLGIVANFVFTAFEMAGQLAGIQMGFSVANVIDPQSGAQLSIVAQFYNIVGIFLFFALNTHLVFISGIKESFELIGPYSFGLTEGLFDGVLAMSSDMFVVALKLAAPISVAILLANLAMGVLARTVPQLNIFVIGFPVTITLGLIILGVSLPFLVSSMSGVFVDLGNNVMDLIRNAATTGPATVVPVPR